MSEKIKKIPRNCLRAELNDDDNKCFIQCCKSSARGEEYVTIIYHSNADCEKVCAGCSEFLDAGDDLKSFQKRENWK